MEEGKKRGKNKRPSASFVTGAIALVFLIIGYQVALFVHKAATLRIEANRDHPDTVYIYASPEVPASAVANNRADATSDAGTSGFAKNKADAPSDASTSGFAKNTVRKSAPHSEKVQAVRERTRKVESFPFNPNTVSVEDLQRLGFSEKQALSIEHYRQKGGRFSRKTDFAKSFVVADSVYRRLEPFIEIPKLDINQADSTALLDLPGIGPFYAGKVVEYRNRLRGYSYPEQLLEIWHFDSDKYNGLRDLITCSRPAPYPIWTLPEEELARHPYISRQEAHGIVLFRDHHAAQDCTLEGLHGAGVLSEEHFSALSRVFLAEND